MHMFKLSKQEKNIVITENPRTRAENKIRFKTVRSKLTVIKKSPMHRGAILWNYLDLDVQNTDSREKFKGIIEKMDFAHVKVRHNNLV